MLHDGVFRNIQDVSGSGGQADQYHGPEISRIAAESQAINPLFELADGKERDVSGDNLPPIGCTYPCLALAAGSGYIFVIGFCVCDGEIAPE